MSLQSNTASHWLGANLESALLLLVNIVISVSYNYIFSDYLRMPIDMGTDLRVWYHHAQVS